MKCEKNENLKIEGKIFKGLLNKKYISLSNRLLLANLIECKETPHFIIKKVILIIDKN